MAKELSVAPKERVNIVYRPATGDAQEEVELPFRLLVLGDFNQKEDDREVEDRDPINVDPNNFNDVLKEQKIALDITVPNKLSEVEGEEMAVKLNINHIKDFEPDRIIKKVPELAKLLELREALKALKAPLGNVPAFRKKLQSLISDQGARERLLKELGIDEEK
jgi:type VI secretion system protein ImpB